MDKKQAQALYYPVKNKNDDTRLKRYKEQELDPKCLDNRQENFGLTNRGELIPCCWLDTPLNRHDKDYQKLLAVSKIEDYDSIHEILLTDEWVEFSKNISNGIGFGICHLTCKKRETAQFKRVTSYGTTGKKERIKES